MQDHYIVHTQATSKNVCGLLSMSFKFSMMHTLKTLPIHQAMSSTVRVTALCASKLHTKEYASAVHLQLEVSELYY